MNLISLEPGFLGTVIGITQALGHLDTKALANDYQNTMEAMLSGLHVKFDSTALALSLSTIMMFMQFLMDRIETHLLATVDIRINELLVGRFAESVGPSDPQTAGVERMGRAVIRSTESLLERQTQLWQSTIEAAHERWSQLVPAAGQQFCATELYGGRRPSGTLGGGAGPRTLGAVADRVVRQCASVAGAAGRNDQAK